MLVKQIKTSCPLNYLQVAATLKNDPYFVFLDSSDNKQANYSYLAFDPFLVFSVENGQVLIKYRSGKQELISKKPFDYLEKLLQKFYCPDIVSFSAGAIGNISYEACRFLTDYSFVQKNSNFPDMTLGFYDKVFIYSHQSQLFDFYETQFETIQSSSFNIQSFIKNHEMSTQKYSFEVGEIQSELSQSSYENAIHQIQRYIREGDCYQVNFTYSNSCPFKGDPFSLYLALRSNSPAPYSAYLASAFGVILSSSPEQLLSSEGNRVTTKPIKGTIARFQNKKADQQQKNSLSNSIKDQAELLMIVDLERNDLARVCRPGSVTVVEHARLETYSHVHHLVSTVMGEKLPGFSALDVFKALFPGGSITGAPKIRSMEIIEELELLDRNSYTGSISYFCFTGSVHSSISIRTMYIKDNKLFYHVGGGIVSDSDPQKEWEETKIKSQGMLNALIEGMGMQHEECVS